MIIFYICNACEKVHIIIDELPWSRQKNTISLTEQEKGKIWSINFVEEYLDNRSQNLLFSLS